MNDKFSFKKEIEIPPINTPHDTSEFKIPR